MVLKMIAFSLYVVILIASCGFLSVQGYYFFDRAFKDDSLLSRIFGMAFVTVVVATYSYAICITCLSWFGC